MKKITLIVCGVLLFATTILANQQVTINTNLGSISIKLFPKIAPKACENFLTLAKKGYYDGTIFHRVIKNFMIQGGDPTGTGRGGESAWGGTFEDEFKPNIIFDRAGILAMANRGANTNGSQFFITTVPTPWLNGRHTIFGEVVGGFEIVNKIEKTKTGNHDKPLEDIKILNIQIK